MLSLTTIQAQIVAGLNIYSPSKTTFLENRRFMFFGGWLDSEQYGHDAIYACRLVGTDGWYRCADITTLKLVDPPTEYTHVNDPEVLEEASERYLVFTACVGSCSSQKNNQVWIAKWDNGNRLEQIRRLLPEDGAAEPTIVPDGPNGTSQVLYTIRTEPHKIYSRTLSIASAQLVGERRVVLDLPGQVISGVSSLFFKGKNLLLWNSFVGNPLQRVDVVYSTSVDGKSWSMPKVLGSPNPDICALLTPNVDIKGNKLWLLAGVVNRETNGLCRLANRSHAIMAIKIEMIDK